MTTIKSLCVYCGASSKGPDSHAVAATRLGEMMAERGVRLVFGGGRVGIMGILADAVLAGGGEVVGGVGAGSSGQRGGAAGCRVGHRLHDDRPHVTALVRDHGCRTPVGGLDPHRGPA